MKSFLSLSLGLLISTFSFLLEACPKGATIDPKNPSVCMSDPLCLPCPEGMFYKHPKPEKGYTAHHCVSCANDFVWNQASKSCIPVAKK